MASSFRFCAAVIIGVGLLALAGCGKVETPAPEAAAPPAPTPPKPATPNSFDEVTAQLDPGGDFYLYLNMAQWLAKLSDGVDSLHAMLLSGSNAATVPNPQEADRGFALLKDVIQKSGLEDITGVGASSFEVSPGLYRNKIFVHHYAANGSGLIWSLYGPGPHDLSGFDFLPADTGAAGVGDFDLAKLINFLRREVDQSGIPEAKQAVDQWQTQFAGTTQLQVDDVLASLSGAIGSVLTLDASNNVTIPVGDQQQTLPKPRIALLIGVKNDLVFKQVEKTLGTMPGVLKVEEPGLRMLTMPMPMLPQLALRPTLAQWNGFLVIATDDQLIRDMDAVRKGAPGFKATPQYAALSAGLPAQGNSFGVCTQRFADTVRQFQTQMFAHQPGANPNQALQFQMLLSKYQNTGPVMAVGSQLPSGWLSVSQGSQGSGQILGPALILPLSIAAVYFASMYGTMHDSR
jgi:hypothetical protein